MIREWKNGGLRKRKEERRDKKRVEEWRGDKRVEEWRGETESRRIEG